MKRYILSLSLLTFFVSLASFSNAQDRTILIEHFTSSTCPPCVPGNQNLTSLLFSRSDYNIVKYQMSWPGSGDPYYVQEGGDRRMYYGVNGVPNSWIDGATVGDIYTPNMTSQQLDAAALVATFLEIEFNTATYDPNSKEVNLDIDVNSIHGNTSDQLRLMVAITENETTGNVGTNGETKFEAVFMKFANTSSGTDLSVLGANETVNQTYTTNMTGTNVEEMDDLRVVAWVEDKATKRVWNTAWRDLQDVATVGIDEESNVSDLRIYPNPFNNEATIEFNLEETQNIAVNVFDVTGKVVQSFPNSVYSAGNYKLNVDGSALQNGLYYVNIVSDDAVITRKLILDK